MRRSFEVLSAAFLVMITLASVVVINVSACSENPRYSITIDEVNGHPTSVTLPTLSNPVRLEGKVGSTDYAGHISQYQVRVDWGDGVVDARSNVHIDPAGDGFAGTWSSDPDHAYLASGTYTIRARLYHQMPPGAESADADVTVTVRIKLEIDVTVATSPAGLRITVDDHTYVAPKDFAWAKCSTHTISTSSPQMGTEGTRYVWTRWSDSGGISHSITAHEGTLTAYFKVQHYLTVQTLPLSLVSIAGSGWKDEGSAVSLTAPTVAGHSFQYWDVDGSQQGTSSQINVKMCEPHIATAHYSRDSEPSPSPSPSLSPSPSPTESPNPSPSPSPSDNPSPSPDPSTSPSPTISPSPSPSSSPNPTESPSPSPSTSPSPSPSPNPSPNPQIVTITFDKAGISSYTGTVVTVDMQNFGISQLPATFTWDLDSTHNFAFNTLLYAGDTRYSWSTTTGLTTLQSGSLKATTSGTVTANYQTQYYLTVSNGGYGTSFGSSWYDAGSQASFSITPTIVPTATSTQYAFVAWSGASTSTSASASITINAPATVTATWKVQYYLTMSTNYGTVTPSSGYYDGGSTLALSAAAPATVDGERYVWIGWTGTGPSSYTGQGNTPSITLNGPMTQAASWTHEYRITTTSAVGTPNPPAGDTWHTAGTQIVASVTGPQAGIDTRETVAGWTGTGSVPQSGATSSVAFTVNQPSTIIWNWKTQYYLTVGVSPVEVLSLNPAAVLGAGWYDQGATATATALITIRGGSGVVYNFVSWTGVYLTNSGADRVRLVMDAPKTVTANYVSSQESIIYQSLTVLTDPSGIVSIPGSGQYTQGTHVFLIAPLVDNYVFNYWDVDGVSQGGEVGTITVVMGSNHVATAHYTFTGNVPISTRVTVTFNQVGVGDDFAGTVVVVDGVSYGKAALPAVFSWEPSSVHEFSYASPLVVGDKRYTHASTSGLSALQAESLTLTQSGTVTASFNTQYKVTFVQTGLDTTATGTVATIGAVSKTLNAFPYNTEWVNSGESISFAYSALVQSSESGKQFRLASTSTQSPLTVTAPNTVSGDYRTRYLITFAQTGLDSSASSQVLTVDGAAKSFGDLQFQKWVDAGLAVTYSYSAQVSAGSSKQFALTGVSGGASGFTVSAATTIVGGYKTQFRVTFSQVGLDSSATQPIVNIAGSPKTFIALPFVSNWVDAGSQLSYSYQTLVASIADGKRFELTVVNGPPSPMIISSPGNVIGQYSVNFRLEVLSSFGNPQGSGWYVANSAATFGVSTPVDQANRTLRVLLNWSGDVAAYEPSGSIVMTKPSTVTANWQTQYLVTFNTTLPNLTVLSIPGVPTTLPPGMGVFGAYYPSGDSVSAGPAPLVVSSTGSTRYTHKGWSLDSGAISSDASISFVVKSPRDVAVMFDTNHLLTVNAIGVVDPFVASVTITASPPVTLNLTPTSPAQDWLLQGADTRLSITTTNKIGHGEWAIFGEWTGQSQRGTKELAITMNAPTSLDAAFSKVNPVAQSLPYSLIAGLVSMGVLAAAVRKKKTPAWRTRLSAVTGAVIIGVALAIAASVSTAVAAGNGINAAELLDFTNWAVVFLAVEALLFMIGSTLLIRKVQRKPQQPDSKTHLSSGKTGFMRQ